MYKILRNVNIIIYLSKIYGDEHPVSYHVLFNLLLCWIRKKIEFLSEHQIIVDDILPQVIYHILRTHTNTLISTEQSKENYWEKNKYCWDEVNYLRIFMIYVGRFNYESSPCQISFSNISFHLNSIMFPGMNNSLLV